MNSTAKGNRTIVKAIDYLSSRGYLTERVEKKGNFIVQKDLFGLFDLVSTYGNLWLYIQVKTNSTDGCLRKVKDFAKEHGNKYTQFWVMVWYDRKGFEIYKYTNLHRVKDVIYEHEAKYFKCNICGRELTTDLLSKESVNKCRLCMGDGS